jgi:hypothetical protein
MVVKNAIGSAGSSRIAIALNRPATRPQHHVRIPFQPRHEAGQSALDRWIGKRTRARKHCLRALFKHACS